MATTPLSSHDIVDRLYKPVHCLEDAVNETRKTEIFLRAKEYEDVIKDIMLDCVQNGIKVDYDSIYLTLLASNFDKAKTFSSLIGNHSAFTKMHLNTRKIGNRKKSSDSELFNHLYERDNSEINTTEPICRKIGRTESIKPKQIPRLNRRIDDHQSVWVKDEEDRMRKWMEIQTTCFRLYEIQLALPGKTIEQINQKFCSLLKIVDLAPEAAQLPVVYSKNPKSKQQAQPITPDSVNKKRGKKPNVKKRGRPSIKDDDKVYMVPSMYREYKRGFVTLDEKRKAQNPYKNLYDPITGEKIQIPAIDKDGYCMERKNWERQILMNHANPFTNRRIASVTELQNVTFDNFNELKIVNLKDISDE